MESTIGERPPRGSGSRLAAAGRELAFVVVGALVISTLIRAFLGQVFLIPSESMTDTLLIGDKVVVEKVTDFQRGDIVVFADPADWLGSAGTQDEGGPLRRALEFVGLLPNPSASHLIKRVIGMPGDTVKCCDTQGRLSVNGQPLDERAYLGTDENGNQVRPSDFDFEVVVPKDRIFVMGDHRDASADSRCHLNDISTDGQPKGMSAFVPIDDVVGPAILILTPFSRFSHLTVPDTFAAVPPPSAAAPDRPTIKPDGVSCY